MLRKFPPTSVKEIDVSKYGVIYAGAQKNIAISGLALAIVDSALVGESHPMTPTVINFAQQNKNDSMLNTPNTFAWYLAGLVFEWLEERGGIAAVEEANKRKASTLYAAIDGSNFYANPVLPTDRSIMNVPFTLADADLDQSFLAAADDAGLAGSKAIEASVACAPASITRCRKRVSMRWLTLCVSSNAPTAKRVKAKRCTTSGPLTISLLPA